MKALLTITSPITGQPVNIPVNWIVGHDEDATAHVPEDLKPLWRRTVVDLSQSGSWIQPYGGLPYRVAPRDVGSTATGIYAIAQYIAWGKVKWKIAPDYPKLKKFDPNDIPEDSNDVPTY